MMGPLREVYRYALPLRRPVLIGGAEKTHATGFLVRVERPDGSTGWGDAAPLDGYSRESQAEVGRALAAGQPGFANDFASVAWATESALHGITSEMESVVATARLITPAATDRMLGAVQDAVQDGFTTIKLKVGGRPVSEDIDLVRQVHAMLPSSVHLRLDANRQWTLDDAVAFARATEPIPFEFVEEPLRDGLQYQVLEDAAALPLALDESLAVAPEWLAHRWRRLKAVVIKPTLLGDSVHHGHWIRWGAERGAYPVISAMYESGVGVRHLLALAARVAPEVAAGLDTYGMLQEDVVCPALGFVGGRLTVRQADPATWTVDVSRLEKIR